LCGYNVCAVDWYFDTAAAAADDDDDADVDVDDGSLTTHSLPVRSESMRILALRCCNMPLKDTTSVSLLTDRLERARVTL